MSHYIEVVPNRKYRPTKLLRKAWRGGKKVKRITIANLSDFHPSVIEGFKAAIKGGGVIFKHISKSFPIKRSLPYGHIVSILELIKKLKFELLLYRESTRTIHLDCELCH